MAVNDVKTEAQFESKIEAQLEQLTEAVENPDYEYDAPDEDGGEDSDVDVTDTEDDSQAELDGENDAPTPAEPAVGDEPTDGPTPAEDSTGSENDTGLSDALFRAAVHQGWKPEEIESFYASDPDKAKATLQRIYDSTNKLTAEFARLGKAKAEADKAAAGPVPVPNAQDEQMARLKEHYGDDDPLVLIVAGLTKDLAEARQQKVVEGPDNDALSMRREVDGFFQRADMKPYAEFYGYGTNPTNEQYRSRLKTLELADSVLLGAAQLGKPMSPSEALSLAHMTVSETIREKVLRNELKASVVKRGRGVTLAPRSQAKGAGSTGPVTAQEMESQVATSMKKLFA